MIILDKEAVLTLHTMLIQQFGGSNGIRDERLLESSLVAPFQTFDGEELYPTINKKRYACG